MALRTPDEAQRLALAGILGHAFAFDPKDAAPWFALAGHDALRVVLRGGAVVAGLIRIPMGWWMGGRSVPMVGVAGVGVAIEARRRGIARGMMADLLHELHREGVALSGLYASNQALYRSVGYDVAAVRHVATLDPRLIPDTERGLQVERLGPAALPELRAMWPDVACHGHLDRGPYLWTRLTERHRGCAVQGLLVRGDAGQLLGWMTYVKAPGADRHTVDIRDLAACRRDAVARLWTCVADMSAMASEVRFATSPWDPFLLALGQPRFEVRFDEHAMLRLVHLPAAVAGRGFSRAVADALVLDVDDPVLPANAGRWRLRVEGGRGELRRVSEHTPPDVRLSIAALASVYSGCVGARALGQGGRAVTGSLEALGRLDALFAGPAPWMREMF